MKRMIAFILIFTLLGSTVAFAEEAKYTEQKSMEDEAWLWEELSKHSPSDEITAGILGYFWRESRYKSDSVAGWEYHDIFNGGDLCETVRTKTDKKLAEGESKEYFIRKARNHGGYGLGQWYSMHGLEALYDFASEYGTSIGDARMQCEFVIESLKSDEELWEKLEKCKDAERAGMLIAVYYDGTETGVDYISYKAGMLYEKYHTEAE